MMEKDCYLGRILTGRVTSGVVRVGDKVHGLSQRDSVIHKVEEGKVCMFTCCQLNIIDLYIFYNFGHLKIELNWTAPSDTLISLCKCIFNICNGVKRFIYIFKL